MKSIAQVVFVATLLIGCGRQVPDPLLASGEQAFVGAYKLDNVLLGPGKLVVLSPESMFNDMGESREQAIQSGALTASQAATLQGNDCTMQIDADHTFIISNLPAADLSKVLSVRGKWSIAVYHFAETYGYRISMNSVPERIAVHAQWFNGNKPEPPIVDLYCTRGQSGGVSFRFAKIKNPPLTRPRR